MARSLANFSIAAVMAATLVASSATAAFAFEPKWPSGTFRYMVIDQDIRDVLTEFGHNIGVPVKLSDTIKEQRVVGPQPDTDARAFLNGICSAYGVVWYYDGSSLHFSAEHEVKSEMINLGRFLRSHIVVRRLEKIGVSDQRYPIRGTADSRIISVSGPPAYRTLVRQEIIAMAKAAESGVLVVRGGREGS